MNKSTSCTNGEKRKGLLVDQCRLFCYDIPHHSTGKELLPQVNIIEPVLEINKRNEMPSIFRFHQWGQDEDVVCKTTVLSEIFLIFSSTMRDVQWKWKQNYLPAQRSARSGLRLTLANQIRYNGIKGKSEKQKSDLWQMKASRWQSTLITGIVFGESHVLLIVLAPLLIG